MLNIAPVPKYVAHMGHWPSGLPKINLQMYTSLHNISQNERAFVHLLQLN